MGRVSPFGWSRYAAERLGAGLRSARRGRTSYCHGSDQSVLPVCTGTPPHRLEEEFVMALAGIAYFDRRPLPREDIFHLGTLFSGRQPRIARAGNVTCDAPGVL